MNETINNILGRRSIRAYKDEPVPKEAVKQLLECAKHAPSGVNMQPWKFTVIQNKEKIRALSGKAKKNYVAWLDRNPGAAQQKFRERMEDPEYDPFYGAPLMIMVFGGKAAYSPEKDCSMACQNMMLAAHSLGLGSCWIGLGEKLGDDQELKKEIGLPEGFDLIGIIVFGYPNESPEPKPRAGNEVLKWVE